MALCWIFSACSTGVATGAPSSGSYANGDGTILFISFSDRLQAYEVRLTKMGETQFIQALALEFENKSMHSASASDLNGDGYGDIVLEGDCGNRTCAHSVYFFDPSTRSLRRVLAKEFSTIARRGDLLILGGGSGCCSFEYQALRLSADRMSVDTKPTFYVAIEAPRAGGDKAKCTFSDSTFGVIPAPKGLLDLCSVYGLSFEAESSEGH
ncbi:FG-GAP repeat domain-containing protein [Ideonella sp. YS5]